MKTLGTSPWGAGGTERTDGAPWLGTRPSWDPPHPSGGASVSRIRTSLPPSSFLVPCGGRERRLDHGTTEVRVPGVRVSGTPSARPAVWGHAGTHLDSTPPPPRGLRPNLGAATRKPGDQRPPPSLLGDLVWTGWGGGFTLWGTL